MFMKWDLVVYIHNSIKINFLFIFKHYIYFIKNLIQYYKFLIRYFINLTLLIGRTINFRKFKVIKNYNPEFY